MKIFRIILLACLTGFLACGEPTDREPTELPTNYLDSQRQQQRTMGDLTIIPGKQLGPVSLGEQSKDVMARFGTPIAGDAAMMHALATYRVDGPGAPATLTVYTSHDTDSDSSVVQLIRSDAISYRDAAGIGVGNSRGEIGQFYDLSLLGSFTEQGDTCRLYAAGRGISFEFTPKGRCRGVVITKADRMPNETYLPIYDNFQVSAEGE